MNSRASLRYPDAPFLSQSEEWEFEGDTGTLLDVWVEMVNGQPTIVGLWEDDTLGNQGQVLRHSLQLGRGELLAEIMADLGSLPVKNWTYREPYYSPPSYIGPWPRRRP